MLSVAQLIKKGYSPLFIVGLDGEDEGDCVEGKVVFGEDKVGWVAEEEELDISIRVLSSVLSFLS